MKLKPLIFGEGFAQSSDAVTPGDWNPAFKMGEGDHTLNNGDVANNAADDKEKVVLKLKPRKKKGKPAPYTSQNIGIHREFLEKGRHYGGDPESYPVGVDGTRSQSTKDYYYAPGEPGISVTSRRLRPLIFGAAGSALSVPHVSAPKSETYADNPDNYGPVDETRHPDNEGDSNFSVKTRPRPVDKHDHVPVTRKRKRTPEEDSGRMVDSKQPSGSPEPMQYSDIGMGGVTWPLASLRPLVFAAPKKKAKPKKAAPKKKAAEPKAEPAKPKEVPAKTQEILKRLKDVKPGTPKAPSPVEGQYFFGYPEYQKSYKLGGKTYQEFGITVFDSEEASEPSYILRFSLTTKPRSKELTLHEGSYMVSSIDPKIVPAPDTDTQEAIFAQIPDEVVQQASEIINPPTPEQKAEEKAKEEAKKAKEAETKAKTEKSKSKQKGAEVSQEEEASKLAVKTARTETRKALADRLAKEKALEEGRGQKVEQKLATQRWDLEKNFLVDAFQDLHADDLLPLIKSSRTEAPASWAKKAIEVMTQSGKFPKDTLAKVTNILMNLEKSYGNKAQAFLGEVFNYIQEKVWKNKRTSYNVFDDPALDKLNPPLTDVERLFTTIHPDDWQDDVYYSDPRRLSSGSIDLLKKDPISKSGNHHYFAWSYASKEDVEKMQEKEIEKEGQAIQRGSSLYVKRLPAWKKVEQTVWNDRETAAR